MLAYRSKEPARLASSPLAAGMSCDWKNAGRIRKAWLSHLVEKEQIRSHYQTITFHIEFVKKNPEYSYHGLQKSSGPGKARWKFLPKRPVTATSNWLSCQGWQVHGMDLVPSNASRMDRFKSSGRVPHERRDLHALRPFILTLLIGIVMIHVKIFIFLLHSHARFVQ